MLTHTTCRWIGRFFLPAALFCFVISESPAVLADEADDEYELALGLYKQKRWELASDTFTKFVKENPKHEKIAFARLYLGQALVNQQKYKPAREVLREFVKNHPQNKSVAQAMYRVGECSYFLDDYKAAIVELNDFLKKAPKDPLNEWGLPYLGDSYYKTKQPESAARVFEYALETYPKGRMKDDCTFGLAKSYVSLKKNDDALKLYGQLAADVTNPRAPQAQMNIGMLSFDAGKYEDASQAFDKFATSFPKNKLVALAQLNSGYAQFYLKKYDAAIERFTDAAKNPAYVDQANYWAAASHKSLKAYDKASKLLETLTDSAKVPAIRQQALYQWADSELQQANYVKARQLYVLYADAYPKTPQAEEGLKRAIEAALLESNPEVGLKLIERFENDFPEGNGIAGIGVLKARFLIQSGTPDELKQAVTLLEPISNAEVNDSKPGEATFHLARAQQKLDQHADAAKTLLPLVTVKSDDDITIPEAFAVRAVSLLESKQFKDATTSASKYLELKPDTPQKQQMLSIVAVAEANLDNARQALNALKQLADESTDKTAAIAIQQQVAEIAYNRKKWDFAATTFEGLMKLSDNETAQIAGLSGLGWSQYEGEKFTEAATTFGKLRTDFAKKKDVASEAAHLQGLSLKKAGQVKEAAKIFQAGFEEFATKEGEAADKTGYNAYLCAKEAARAYRDLKQIADSDTAYKAAYDELKQQPAEKQTNLDKLLDEWGLLHYEAEDYDRADEIFKILLAETPDSDRADDAKLTLAESDFAAAEFDKARKAFSELAESEKSDEVVKRRALYQLVALTSSLEDWPALEKTCQQYLKDYKTPNPDFPQVDFANEITYRLAEAESQQQKNKEANARLVDLMKQVEQELDGKAAPPTVEAWIPGIWLLAAETSRRLKNYKDVSSYSTQFDQFFPNNPRKNDLQITVGRVQIAKAELPEAQKTFESVLENLGTKKSETAAQAEFFKAETQLMQKNHADALKSYLRVYHLYDGYAQWQSAALYQAGQCDEVLGNAKNAIESYRDLVSQFPNSQYSDAARKRLKALKVES